jgi:H+-transporting ATPase
MGLFDLTFCVTVLALCKYRFGFGVETLQTLTLVTLVFSGQAIFYVVRERRRIWSSRPSNIVILSSIADMLIIPTLAVRGALVAPLPLGVGGAIFAAAIVFALTLDTVKALIFRHLGMM